MILEVLLQPEVGIVQVDEPSLLFFCLFQVDFSRVCHIQVFKLINFANKLMFFFKIFLDFSKPRRSCFLVRDEVKLEVESHCSLLEEENILLDALDTVAKYIEALTLFRMLEIINLLQLLLVKFH
jgi:hypothetical protein